MLRQIGYTKGAKIIFQNFENGDVTIKQNESDEAGIYYPYEEWKYKKAEIAELETIKEEFDPMTPEERMRRRAAAAKAAATIALQVLRAMLTNARR